MNDLYPISIDAYGDLDLVMDHNGGDLQARLEIPDGCLVISYSSGAATYELTSVASTVGPARYDSVTGIADFVDAPALDCTTESTGVTICPPSGSALVTTALQLELDGGGHPIVGP